MNKVRRKVLMTDFQRRIFELDAKAVKYYRRNPCIAAEDLLGIQLLDSQKYILQSSWNTPHCVWCCSRNFGKSFIGAVFMILKAILYENQAIYIISSVGDQSKQTFMKLEEIILRIGKTAASIDSLVDIVEKETEKSPTNKTGFSHPPEGFHVKFYNSSEIFTLNSNPDNARSRRATLVFFDEAAYCAAELIAVCEAFATQNMDFKTSVSSTYNPEMDARKMPTQLIYASSQDEVTTTFYKHYKNFAKKYIAGDRNYFVCDMICDTAIDVYIKGQKWTPLLERSKVDAALKSNKTKALREYYNQPTLDGGANQIIKWGAIRRNEAFYLPQLHWEAGYKYVLAFDPARTSDNSIVSVMRLWNDEQFGMCGDIVNCVNFLDVASKHKYKLDTNKQLEGLWTLILNYNGNNPDYEYIDSVFIDAGAGGGGVQTYGDGLLNEYTDSKGVKHRGLIDKTYPVYVGYEDNYPNNADKLRLIEPKKNRTKMVEEFIELFDLGLIRLPYEFKQDVIEIIEMSKDGNEEITSNHELNEEEIIALSQIDLMKEEITSIQKTSNLEKTSVTYAISKDKENTMHDDRFYTIIMLAHRLYELRRGEAIKKEPEDDWSNAPSCVSTFSW